MKKTYTKPTVEKVGTFESVTKAAGSGNLLDATFPLNTPFSAASYRTGHHVYLEILDIWEAGQ